MRYYIPETRGYRIASTTKLFPAYCKMPAIEPGDTIKLAAQDLIQAICNRIKHTPIDLAPKHTEALRDLTRILAEATSNYDEHGGSDSPVVNEYQLPSSLANPT